MNYWLANKLQRCREDDGVFSVLTLLFLVVLGLGMLFFIWLLIGAIGAFNTLYIANQNAAVAAAATARSDAAVSGPQLGFICGSSASGLAGRVICAVDNRGGSATAAAAAVSLENAFRGAPFGIRFGDQPGANTYLDFSRSPDPGASANPLPRVLAYSVDISSADARNNNCTVSGSGSPSSANRFRTGRVSSPNLVQGSPETAIHCWSVYEEGSAGEISYPVQYSSGVVTRVAARPELIDNAAICPSGDAANAVAVFVRELCRPLIVVVAAASQSQPEAYDDYTDYRRP